MYLLLCPLSPELFNLETFDEIEEALDEFGCGMLLSKNTNDEVIAFAGATTQEALEQMCTAVNLPGIAVKITEVFDQFVEEKK